MSGELIFSDDNQRERIVGAFVTAVGGMTMGFMKLTTQEGREYAEPAGTGTFVQLGDVYGILTAAHVLEELPEKGQVGIVRFRNQIEHITIDMGQTERLIVGAQPFGEFGPDLGFLLVPHEMIGWLKATGVFYKLERHLAGNTRPQRAAIYCDALVGVIAEKTVTTASSPLSTKMRTTHIKAHMWPGYVVREYGANGFDLLDFEPVFADENDWPFSFEGVSGGGLWRMMLSEDREIVDKKLTGTAFYQSPAIEGRRTLTCHGPEGIYGPLVNAIKARWSAT